MPAFHLDLGALARAWSLHDPRAPRHAGRERFREARMAQLLPRARPSARCRKPIPGRPCLRGREASTRSRPPRLAAARGRGSRAAARARPWARRRRSSRARPTRRGPSSRRAAGRPARPSSGSRRRPAGWRRGSSRPRRPASSCRRRSARGARSRRRGPPRPRGSPRGRGPPADSGEAAAAADADARVVRRREDREDAVGRGAPPVGEERHGSAGRQQAPEARPGFDALVVGSEDLRGPPRRRS